LSSSHLQGKPHRATKDLDLLGRESPDVARLVQVFREIAAVPCPEERMAIDADGIPGAPTREDATYDGYDSSSLPAR
jgi:hypothetical protein